MELIDLLAELMMQDGSDLHLVAGHAPVFRVEGTLIPQAQHPVLKQDSLAPLLSPYIDARQQAMLESGHDVQRAVRIRNRIFRLHVFRERGGLAASIRVIPSDVPPLDSLELNDDTLSVFRRIVEQKRGLVLVVGPTGSGKSTTAAALVEEINRTRSERIVTVEDPISFEFKAKQSLITQRVVGEDVAEFSLGLRSMMEEDPDVILVSEMRDMESVMLTLTLAETGHLVFTTLGVGSTSEAVARLIEMWPESRRPTLRRLLAYNLSAVIAQRLVPRFNRPGRVAVHEILLGTPRVKQMIQEGHADLTVAIEAGRNIGMQTMDDDLMRLYRDGSISRELTWLHLTDKGRLPQETAPSPLPYDGGAVSTTQ